MRPTRSVIFSAVASATLLVSATGCGSLSEAVENKEDIVIAADLELSGAAAAVGTAYDRALRLKVEQINAAGVLDGRKIRLEVRDNRSDKTLSASNIGEFTNDSSVSAIITGSCTDCILASAKTANDKKMPTVSLAPATDVTNPVAERQYIFKIGPNPLDDAAVIASELRRTSSIRNVGLLTTEDQYGSDGVAAMKNELDAADSVRVSAEATIKPTDTDVSQAVRQVLDEQPDALVVWAYSEQAQRVAAAARDQGYRDPIILDAAAAGDLFLAGSVTNTTLIFTQTMAIDDVIATNPAKAARKQWFRDYTSRYGSYFGPASFAADALQLIVDAMNRTGGTNRDEVREAMETVQVEGLSGAIRITPANHSGLMPQALVALTAASGRWRLKT